MSIAYETGPVHVYASLRSTFPVNLLNYPSASAIDYIGTGEMAPDIIKQTKFDPVFNDLGGSLPWDYLFQGEEAVVPVNFTVFNWSVLSKLNAMPIPSGTPGTFGTGGVGTLMLTEGYAYHLWLHFPYYSYKTIFSTASMVNGYHFWASFADSIVIQPGTKANKARVNFKCVRLYQPASVGNGFTLFDHSMANIPATPPTAASGAVA